MTEDIKKVWYHCGKCGSLFQSGFGQNSERVCEECAQKPSTGLWPAQGSSETASVEREVPIYVNRGEEMVEDSGRKAVRKKRKTNVMMRVIVAWTFVMLLAVWLRHHYTKKDSEKEKQEAVAGNMTKGTLADERVALLNSALPDCHRALGGFLTSGTPEARNQFVADPIETAGKMAIFYANNPFPNVDVKKLTRVSQEIVKVGGEWMISTRWKEQDGMEFEALFRRDSGTWRLDWEQFNRYSDYPWALFLAGEGKSEYEFRLLARQRMSGDDAEQTGARLNFVMMAPEFGKPAEMGMESPEFVVDRRSDEGLLLEAAFHARADKKPIFGLKSPNPEPDGLIRVHVRVKREELGGVRKFVLEKVIGCHWITTEDPGFDLKSLKEDIFGN